MRRALAVGFVAGSALLAYAAVGNGDIRATESVTAVTVTSPAGSGTGIATLENTTTSTTYNVLVDADATCDPDMTFSIAGGNPITNFAPMTARDLQIGCPPRDTRAMRRCLYRATNTMTGAALAELMGVCVYGDLPATLTPLAPALDFGSVAVGDFAQQTLTIRNDGAGPPITRVYLQTSDAEGHFQFAGPCNPDASYCDQELTEAIEPGATFAVGVKCRPQAPGTHTAEVLVGTDTFQLMSLGVTLQCTGTPAAVPALGVQPTAITLGAPVEVMDETAEVVVHLENAGDGTLVIGDVRTVDVVAGAATDWTYSASGKCSGQITSGCSLGMGDRVDINLTFDPSEIGGRRAALLVSYHDTLDRTLEIPLDGSGHGATLRRLGPATNLAFGTVPIGESSQLEIELSNGGTRDTTASLSLEPMSTPPFTLSPQPSVTVSPASPRTITLTCAPTTAGTFTTTVSVDATDASGSLPIAINATCEGSLQELYASPTTLQLGELRLDADPLVRTIQVLSTDPDAPLTLAGQPQLESPNPSVSVGELSQLTTPATFDVIVDPQSEGQLTASIILASTAGDQLRIPMSATITRASYLVSNQLDLGTFCVDQPTTASNVSLVSDGTAEIELLEPLLGQAPSPFDLALTTPLVYPHPLPSGRAASVTITPKRRQDPAAVADTLTWRTDVAIQLTAPTELTARFIDSGAAIAPPVIHFGEVTAHLYTDNGQRVVIQNCNPTPLVLDPPIIRTPFSIDSPKFPTMLEPNESVAFSVGFHPTRIGAAMDTLRITSPQLPGAPLEVLLIGFGGSGSGVPPDAPVGSNTYDDTSFYACSCTTTAPAGGVPFALAIVWVVRPRRRRTPPVAR